MPLSCMNRLCHACGFICEYLHLLIRTSPIDIGQQGCCRHLRYPWSPPAGYVRHRTILHACRISSFPSAWGALACSPAASPVLVCCPYVSSHLTTSCKTGIRATLLQLPVAPRRRATWGIPKGRDFRVLCSSAHPVSPPTAEVQPLLATPNARCAAAVLTLSAASPPSSVGLCHPPAAAHLHHPGLPTVTGPKKGAIGHHPHRVG